MTTDPIKWLQESRNLDGALLAHMGVKRVRHPGLGECVAFPYRVSGEAPAAKFRSVEKRWSSTKGVKRGLYNIDALSTDECQPVVITEGEIDCLSVIQSGYVRTVSLPDGWTEEGGKTAALIEAEDMLRRSPFVVVAGDADRAGESLPRTVANILKGHDVRYAEWPTGCKDANDVLMLLGEGDVAACIARAKRIDPPGGFITGLSDLPPLSDRRVLRSGVREVDWRVALEVGTMSVLTGIPGMGKSTFATWLAHRIAENERVRVGFMAFETHAHRTRDHLCRLETGMPFDRLAPDARQPLMELLDQRFRLVHRTYDDTSHNLGWLEAMVHALAVRDRCKLIIIDPWNELEHMPEPGESLTNYINFATKCIRQWAEKLGVHIMVVAHPKKLATDMKIRPPQGYDVADSAAFANKPSLGITVHVERDDLGQSFTHLLNWKVRDVQLYGASKGKSIFKFDVNAMNYTPVSQQERDE